MRPKPRIATILIIPLIIVLLTPMINDKNGSGHASIDHASIDVKAPVGEIAFIRDEDIWVVRPDGSNLQQLTNQGGYSEPTWSRDGRFLAFVHFFIAPDSKGAYEIGIFDIQTNQKTIVVPAEKTPFPLLDMYYTYKNPRWSMDDLSFYYIAVDHRAQGETVHRVDIKTGEKDVGFNPFHGVSIDISPTDGKIVYYDYFNGIPNGDTINLANPDGSQSIVLVPLEDGRYNRWPRFSPDGSDIAFVRSGWPDEFMNIELLNLESRVRTVYPVDNFPVYDNLFWSPDGTKIIYDTEELLMRFLDLSDGSITAFINGTDPSWNWAMPGDIDLIVDSVVPVQVIDLDQLNPDDRYLVKGKSTAVKVRVTKKGSTRVNNVSVRLSLASFVTTNFFVDEANNRGGNNELLSDNREYPLNFPAGDSTKTIYFFGNGLIPRSETFKAIAFVDYLNAIPEIDESDASNKRSSLTAPVVKTSWGLNPDFSIEFFRTDWGNTPSSLFSTYFSSNSKMIGGVMPVSDSNYQPRAEDTVESTASFRGLDGKLSERELRFWIKYTLLKMKLSLQETDRYVAVVPQNWFADHTSLGDKKGDTHYQGGWWNWPNLHMMVITEAYLSDRWSMNIVSAHEIGHSFGLDVHCEEYDPCNETIQDGIGNYADSGIWVNTKIPMNDSRKIYCLMGKLGGEEYWIDIEDFTSLLSDRSSVTTTPSNERMSAESGPNILAIGSLQTDGEVSLDDWYILEETEAASPPPGPYIFEYQDSQGKILHEVSFDLSNISLDGTPIDSPFLYSIPHIAGVSRILIKNSGSILAEKVISPHIPEVQVLFPNGGEIFSSSIDIQWTGSDADGDSLSYAVLISDDGGLTWETLAVEVADMQYTWQISPISASSQYLIKVLATDGFNTNEDESDAPFTIIGRYFMPIVIK